MSTVAHGEVRVPPGPVLPLEFTVTTETSREHDAVARMMKREPTLYEARVTARWNDRRQCYEVVRLDVQPGWQGAPITQAGLRTLRIEEFVKGAEQLIARTDEGAVIPFRVPRSSGLPQPDETAFEGDRIVAIAQRYVLARAFAGAPLKAVAETFGVSQSTATRLVARARALGLVAQVTGDEEA